MKIKEFKGFRCKYGMTLGCRKFLLNITLIHFWEKWGEDTEVCPLRIIGVAPEYGDFPQNHFWEHVFGILFLGVPVKWGFLFPENKMPILPFLGISTFGKVVSVLGFSQKCAISGVVVICLNTCDS